MVHSSAPAQVQALSVAPSLPGSRRKCRFQERIDRDSLPFELAALERAPFVVTTELFLTETASLATLVLPVQANFEKRGHVTDLTGDLLAAEPGHAALAGTLGDGDVLVALAAELGIEVPGPDELRERATRASGSPAASA